MIKTRLFRNYSKSNRLLAWRRRGTQSVNLLPHLLTIANLASGVVSIILASQGYYLTAALVIFLAMIFDAFDGRLARWLKAEGEFGKEMDSLADLVSFGVAPAFMLFELNLKHLGALGWVITVLFPVCGALRLARFNLLNVKGHFVGIPITAAGGLLASFVVYGQKLDHWSFSLATAAISLLMISTVRYPDFKNAKLIKLRLAPIIVPTILTVLILRAEPRSVIFLPLTLYAASGLYLHILRKLEELFLNSYKNRPQERH